jgi:hypothetical protein
MTADKAFLLPVVIGDTREHDEQVFRGRAPNLLGPAPGQAHIKAQSR